MDSLPGPLDNAFLTRNPYHAGLAVTSNCDLAPVAGAQHAHYLRK